jgi:hypothetical protein
MNYGWSERDRPIVEKLDQGSIHRLIRMPRQPIFHVRSWPVTSTPRSPRSERSERGHGPRCGLADGRLPGRPGDARAVR